MLAGLLVDSIPKENDDLGVTIFAWNDVLDDLTYAGAV